MHEEIHAIQSITFHSSEPTSVPSPIARSKTTRIQGTLEMMLDVYERLCTVVAAKIGVVMCR